MREQFQQKTFSLNLILDFVQMVQYLKLRRQNNRQSYLHSHQFQ
jgi:hypothetical protein